jgi:hypothetical protein
MRIYHRLYDPAARAAPEPQVAVIQWGRPQCRATQSFPNLRRFLIQNPGYAAGYLANPEGDDALTEAVAADYQSAAILQIKSKGGRVGKTKEGLNKSLNRLAPSHYVEAKNYSPAGTLFLRPGETGVDALRAYRESLKNDSRSDDLERLPPGIESFTGDPNKWTWINFDAEGHPIPGSRGEESDYMEATRRAAFWLKKWIAPALDRYVRRRALGARGRSGDPTAHLPRVEIIDPGDTKFSVQDRVERSVFLQENQRVVARGGTPATGEEHLRMVTRGEEAKYAKDFELARFSKYDVAYPGEPTTRAAPGSGGEIVIVTTAVSGGEEHPRDPMPLYRAMIREGLAKTQKEVRLLIDQGVVKVNGVVIRDGKLSYDMALSTGDEVKIGTRKSVVPIPRRGKVKRWYYAQLFDNQGRALTTRSEGFETQVKADNIADDVSIMLGGGKSQAGARTLGLPGGGVLHQGLGGVFRGESLLEFPASRRGGLKGHPQATRAVKVRNPRPLTPVFQGTNPELVMNAAHMAGRILVGERDYTIANPAERRRLEQNMRRYFAKPNPIWDKGFKIDLGTQNLDDVNVDISPLTGLPGNDPEEAWRLGYYSGILRGMEKCTPFDVGTKKWRERRRFRKQMAQKVWEAHNNLQKSLIEGTFGGPYTSPGRR